MVVGTEREGGKEEREREREVGICMCLFLSWQPGEGGVSRSRE